MRLLRCTIMLLQCGIMAACGIDDVYVYRDGGVAPDQAQPPAQRRPDPQPQDDRFDSATKILAHLEGKNLVMPADAIPSHPNGYDENVNFGQATQCIHRVTMEVAAGSIRVRTEMATLEDAPDLEDVGRCDRARPTGDELAFDTTAVLLENVTGNGECFDLTLTYAGFGQEGRGSIDENGNEVRLELFFRDQAIGHRCADGNVGERSITLDQQTFTADAVQVYRVEDQ